MPRSCTAPSCTCPPAGLASEEDTFSYIQSKGYNPLQAAQGSATLQVEGGAIEAGVNYCTTTSRPSGQAGVPATFNFHRNPLVAAPGTRI
nr:hypothetical protein [Corynebacterium accolens]